MNTNFKVIGLTRLGIKPKSTAQETDALTTRPSELLIDEQKPLKESPSGGMLSRKNFENLYIAMSILVLFEQILSKFFFELFVPDSDVFHQIEGIKRLLDWEFTIC